MMSASRLGRLGRSERSVRIDVSEVRSDAAQAAPPEAAQAIALKPNVQAKSIKRALPDQALRRLDTMMAAMREGEKNFAARLNTHADWTLIHLLLENEAAGRATVARHVIELAGCSPGTVRAILARFRREGYITLQQRIGRSELYQPTDKLRGFVRRWAEAIPSLG